MYVPNNVKSFGSASHEFKVLGCANVQTLSVGQTQWSYLDKPSQKCTKEHKPDATACIAEYIQSRVKCNINILGQSPHLKNTTCSEEQKKEFVKISKLLENADDTSIYDETRAGSKFNWGKVVLIKTN